MRVRPWIIAFVLAALLCPLASVPTLADSDQDRARQCAQSGQCVPLNQVLKSVRRQYKGQVLDTQLYDAGGRWIYRVRVLGKDGQVRDVGVDGRSGQIIGVQ
jgi:uncharacterized membrane protein YkoI